MNKSLRRLRRWLKQVLIALDQALNALLGGWPDETLSSRCWRLRHLPGWGTARRVLDFVAGLLGDKDHCRASYDSEWLRLQCPPELRPPDRP